MKIFIPHFLKPNMIPSNNRIRIPKNSHIKPEVSSPDTTSPTPMMNIINPIIAANSSICILELFGRLF